MMATQETDRARRYLLGLLSEQEQAAIEKEYLVDQDAADRVAAAEDELIEDHLAGRLSGRERDRFEQGYLSTPHHRVRVETVRRLLARANTAAPAAAPAASSQPPTTATVVEFSRRERRGQTWFTQWMPKLALAASLIILAATAWLFVSRRTGDSPEHASRPTAQPSGVAPESTPRSASTLLALRLSPVAVRGAADNPSVTIPLGTDQLSLRLESDGGGLRLSPTRVSIQTVIGTEIWQGTVARTPDLPSGTAAQVDVPATSLTTDDYIVTLYGTDRSNAEQEWMQYFLRVRRP